MAELKQRGRPAVYLTKFLELMEAGQSLTKPEIAAKVYDSAAHVDRIGPLIESGRRKLQPKGRTITAIPFDRPGMGPGYRYKMELAIDESLAGLRARTARAKGYANGFASHADITARSFPQLQGLILGRLISVSTALATEQAQLNERVVRALRAGNVEELAAVDPDVKQLIAQEEDYYAKLDSR